MNIIDQLKPLVEYISKNKEWLFSGAGVSVVAALLALLRRALSQRPGPIQDEHLRVPPGRKRRQPEGRHTIRAKKEDGTQDAIPSEWQTIMPARSKYVFNSEPRSDIPLGLQSFSFEYAPDGHAHPLMLKNVMVRAELGFTCRIDNVYKALFAANDYALNVLPPQFLVHARDTLERYSFSELREKRREASSVIVAAMAPQFQKLGVRLESVTIGALEALANQNPVDLGHAKGAAISPTDPTVTSCPETKKYDVFLSHASEDKLAIARPLYEAMVAAGISVWFDEAVLVLGDSLRRKIDDGLSRCSYGVIIISPSFLSKEWPQKELDGLVALEVQSGKTKILPIWHDIEKDTLLQRSPILADRVAGRSSEGIPALVQKILAVVCG